LSISSDDADFPKQKIDYLAYDAASLPNSLGLKKPPFAENVFGQLEYIAQYVSHPDLNCQSIAIERRHIDRDYMEDHGIFYSKCLRWYPNFCQRVHFFALPVSELQQTLARLIADGRKEGLPQFRSKSEGFSNEYYLGFSVIKPLPGCPVGRSVLRPLGEKAADGDRHFQCTRTYTIHFAGIPLVVRGLAFQQQDAGVSACATTALWSALQKTRDFEEIGISTPARITTLAAQYDLPFGRSMPSEGLSIGQVCLAVQALGVSPNLFSIEDFNLGRDLIFAATDSGIASVLIIQKEDDINYHAVTVAGMKLRHPREITELAQGIGTVAGDLRALYIHDDRKGPYVRADVVEKNVQGQNRLGLNLEFKSLSATEIEPWILSHILIPMHGKVRLSFTDLRELALRMIIPTLHAFRQTELPNSSSPTPSITFASNIWLAHQYLERVLFGPQVIAEKQFDTLREKVLCSRYVGVVRVNAPFIDGIDVLFDTTSTLKNLVCLGIVPLGGSQTTREAAECFSKRFECPLITG